MVIEGIILVKPSLKYDDDVILQKNKERYPQVCFGGQKDERQNSQYH